MIDLNPHVFEIASRIYNGYKDDPRYIDKDISISCCDADSMQITIISNGYITEFKISQNFTLSNIIIIAVQQCNLAIPNYREETLITHNINERETNDIRNGTLNVNLYGLAEYIINLLIKQGELK